jgi:hypothetical protein
MSRNCCYRKRQILMTIMFWFIIIRIPILSLIRSISFIGNYLFRVKALPLIIRITIKKVS